MKRYETIVIADPDVSEENRTALFERYQGIISQRGGFLVEIDAWRTRPLAYEIKKKGRGFYFRLDYCGVGSLVDEIERFSRIDDHILKYLTVLIASDVDLEQIKAETARKKEAEKAASIEAAATPETPQAATTESATAGETVVQPDETPSKE